MIRNSFESLSAKTEKAILTKMTIESKCLILFK